MNIEKYLQINSEKIKNSENCDIVNCLSPEKIKTEENSKLGNEIETYLPIAKGIKKEKKSISNLNDGKKYN